MAPNGFIPTCLTEFPNIFRQRKLQVSWDGYLVMGFIIYAHGHSVCACKWMSQQQYGNVCALCSRLKSSHSVVSMPMDTLESADAYLQDAKFEMETWEKGDHNLPRSMRESSSYDVLSGGYLDIHSWRKYGETLQLCACMRAHACFCIDSNPMHVLIDSNRSKHEA